MLCRETNSSRNKKKTQRNICRWSKRTRYRIYYSPIQTDRLAFKNYAVYLYHTALVSSRTVCGFDLRPTNREARDHIAIWILKK